MFSISDRLDVRTQLLSLAETDERIVGAALAGSAARDAEDEWSDIDLVLQMQPAADEPAIVEDWTRHIDEAFGVADTLDVIAGGVRYRVFFLRSSLQLDISFWPQDQFRATEPAFRLLFGTPNEPTEPKPVNIGNTIGMGWLYAIHARSAVARGRLWQATMMIDELRSSLVTLKCISAGLNPWHGREVDQLPEPDLAAIDMSRARSITPEEIERSRVLISQQFIDEIAQHDPDRSERLREPFSYLAVTVH